MPDTAPAAPGNPFPVSAEHPTPRTTVWSPISLLIALSCAMAIWRDDIVRVPDFAWMPLCLLGITAGMIGLVKDQRITWRSRATVSAVVSLVVTGAPSLFVWLIWG